MKRLFVFPLLLAVMLVSALSAHADRAFPRSTYTSGAAATGVTVSATFQADPKVGYILDVQGGAADGECDNPASFIGQTGLSGRVTLSCTLLAGAGFYHSVLLMDKGGLPSVSWSWSDTN